MITSLITSYLCYEGVRNSSSCYIKLGNNGLLKSNSALFMLSSDLHHGPNMDLSVGVRSLKYYYILSKDKYILFKVEISHYFLYNKKYVKFWMCWNK